MLITNTSIISGITRTIDLPVTEAQVNAFKSGMLVQHAFPNLSPSDREFFLSGSTLEEWDTLKDDDENF